MGVPLTPLLSNPLFELGTEEGTLLINNQIHFCIHPLINRLDHSVQNGRQHWEIQPFVAQSQKLIKPETNVENECSNKKKSHNLMQLKTDAENSCNQKRTPKTNAQKSVTKPHAVKNER
jgi:CYTH domain-containing protein